MEWPELCRRLADYASSARGKELCLRLLPECSLEKSRQEMMLTSEMVRVLEDKDGLPIDPLGDMEPLIAKARRGQRLQGTELAQIGVFLESVARVRRSILGTETSYPGLASLARALEEAASLRESIQLALDQDGKFRDGASAKLRHLRREAKQKRQEIVKRLEAFIRGQEAGKLLQDTYYTVREGRFVLPVRSEVRARVGGILHDVSSSGATSFLEPPWLVELNNALRMTELEIQREEERILEVLSRAVGAKADSIAVDQEVLARLDMIQARARLSVAVSGSELLCSYGKEVALRALRHPLLALRGKKVVANHVSLNLGQRVMVVSGPNAGGKTVLLKALGLAALMAGAGIHPPVDSGSRLGFFPLVLADIGDQQDLERDFSTFSAHMRNIKEILEVAHDGSLVLLDELAGSTDPQQGAALALAILEELLDRGAVVVATTHYPQVKLWAKDRDGAQNAAMEFDWDKLVPTYRLREGVPGQSSALEIARRMQVPHRVLETAATKLGGDQLRLETLLQEVQRERSSLEEQRFQLETAKARMQELVAKQEELVRSLKEERENFLREKRRRLWKEIQEARETIRQTLICLRAARSPKEALEARISLEDLASNLRSPPPETPVDRLPLGEVKPGDMVQVIPLGKPGVLLEELSNGKTKVRVRVGKMDVLTDVTSLGGVIRTQAQQGSSGGDLPTISAPRAEVPLQLDLRGMRAEEALEEMARYLDRALLGSSDEVRIIHGHGTGSLKKAVRDWLSGCGWIAGFRPGVRAEGGDGVTVVQLRARRIQEGA